MTKEELFEKNQPLAMYIANKFKGYDREFEDIKQLAFEGLWYACIKFDGRGAFSTLAYPCIKNRILHYLRTVKKHNLHDRSINKPINEDLYLEDLMADDSDPFEDVLDSLTIKEAKEWLNDILDTDRKKYIFNEYLKGNTQKNIADELNLSQCQISRIQSNLKNELKECILI